MRTKNQIPARITVRMLNSHVACPGGVQRFTDVFGRSGRFVPGNIYRAYDSAARADLPWLLAVVSYDTFLSTSDAFSRHFRGRNLDGVWTSFCAAALCRLARQNLPNRKGK